MHDHFVGLTVVLEQEEMDYGGGSNGNGNTNTNDYNNRQSIFSVADTSDTNNNPSLHVLNKFSVIKAVPLPPPPSPTSPRSSDYTLRGSFGSNFLERCSHCRKIMLPGFDVYMYMGDRGFCTTQCRYEYMFWDEKSLKKTAAESCLYLVKPSSSSSSGSKNKGK